jgi:S1-C subfamily serine protease
VLLLLFACGAKEQPPAEPASRATAGATSGAEAEAAEPPPETAIGGSGQIDRGMLGAVLEAGLGRFLQGVETEPALADGRFVGFRLLSLYPDDPRMANVGLERGDVITRVNGQPIERPEQALRVWDGLRVASELVIEYRRGEAEHELRFAIVD